MTTKAERQSTLDYAMSVVQLDSDGFIMNSNDAVELVMAGCQVSRQRAVTVVAQAARRMRHDDTASSPGRPATMADGETVAIYLPASMIAKARRLGDGNISAGVRRCIEAHDELDEDSL